MTTTPAKGFRVNPRVAELILIRKRARQERERRQQDLIPKEDILHGQIADKLLSIGECGWTEVWGEPDAFGEPVCTGYKKKNPWLENFIRCGLDTIVRHCNCCGARETYTVNCSQKFCPRCSWKLTKTRTNLIKKWATKIKTPLHVVTTQRNFEVLTKRKITGHTKNLAKLRHRKFFAHVRGGTTSVEITNEGRGWHLHAHWLLDADELDPSQLSIQWGKLVGQEFAIVKVKPVTSKDYIGELAKYVCEPSSMAQWPAEHIWEFCNAIRGRRFFFTFGALSKLAPDIRREIAQEKPEAAPCDCGSFEFKFLPPDANP